MAGNLPPDTTSLNLTGNEDTPISVPFAGHDDGVVVAFIVVTELPTHGKLVNAANQTLGLNSTVAATGNGATIFYVPDANYNGTDFFHYAAIDNNGVRD